MSSDSQHHDHGFYVGYLPAPAAHARLARAVGAGLIVLFAALAGGLAVSQSNPGRGTWDADDGSTFEGSLLVDPYPHLLTRDERGEPLDAVLVEQGKIGATARAMPFSGQRVRIKGGLIRWGGRAAIELAGTPDDVTPVGAGTDAAAHATPLLEASAAPTTLLGEIVDPKCYLGVMNPGHGKPHLSCAQLCIRGGIPPVLVVRDGSNADDEGSCYLLTTSAGGAANEAVRGWVGHAVRITGTLRPAASSGGWASMTIERINAVK
jgi:hypothetical protein